MGHRIKISDIFKSLGQPTATYVEREEGVYEKKLTTALQIKGRLCLLTGASKTGKTCLYKKVLSDQDLEPLVVRCDSNLSAEDFWKKALEGINFERLSGTQIEKARQITGKGEVEAKIGWTWLAGLLGKASLGITSKMGETEIREKILSKPSPDHLVPVLQKLPIILVIEDFHYLLSEVKKTIFQQWKVFVDNEVSVIVIGTTHHAVDLAYANKDLVGRISQIDISSWTKDDLLKIAIQGFNSLGLQVPNQALSPIAAESAGLPIITQAACYQLFIDKGIEEVEHGKLNVQFSKSDAYQSLYNNAITNYAQFEPICERLKNGARKRARKYNTYELVLSTFIQDPQTFSLKRHEIDERLKNINIPAEKRPPVASINSMLNALARLQKNMGIELLEWSNRDQRLYILEPSFLLYLRWREQRKKPPTLEEFMASISEVFRSIVKETFTELQAKRTSKNE